MHPSSGIYFLQFHLKTQVQQGPSLVSAVFFLTKVKLLYDYLFHQLTKQTQGLDHAEDTYGADIQIKVYEVKCVI